MCNGALTFENVSQHDDTMLLLRVPSDAQLNYNLKRAPSLISRAPSATSRDLAPSAQGQEQAKQERQEAAAAPQREEQQQQQQQQQQPEDVHHEPIMVDEYVSAQAAQQVLATIALSTMPKRSSKAPLAGERVGTQDQAQEASDEGRSCICM